MVTHNIAFCRYILQEKDVPEDDRLYAEAVIRAWDETKEVYTRAPIGPLPVDVNRELARAEVLRDRQEATCCGCGATHRRRNVCDNSLRAFCSDSCYADTMERIDQAVDTADQCTFCDQPEDLTVWVGGPCCAQCRVAQGLGRDQS